MDIPRRAPDRHVQQAFGLDPFSDRSYTFPVPVGDNTMSEPTDSPAPSSRIAEVSELVKRLCLAITQVEVFAPTHPLSRKAVASAFEWIAGMFERRKEPIVLSVSDKKLILDGIPLEDKNPLVAKLGAKLDAFHITNLFIEPGLTAGELQTFYDIIGRGGRVVAEQGGLPKLLADAALPHLGLRDVSYVMVTDGQRVVDRDTPLAADKLPGGLKADADIVRFMIGKVLGKAEEQQWLLSEIKNNPDRMAGLIAEGIELATSRAEMGMEDKGNATETLISNIKLVAAGLTQARDQGDLVTASELEKTILSLENEVRLRSSKLMSGKIAQGFLNEILALVTSYSDRIRARQITDEFLKGENNLKRAEKLLRQLAPRTEKKEDFLARIRALLIERGMAPEDVERLAQSMADERRKRTRRPVAQAVQDGVARRLADLALEPAQLQDVTASLGAFVEERARDKAAEYREEAERLQREVERRTQVLEAIPWGVILWAEDGTVSFINPAAGSIVRQPAGMALRPAVADLLNALQFPLNELPDFPAEAGLTEFEIRLVVSVFRPLTNPDGKIQGVILMPER